MTNKLAIITAFLFFIGCSSEQDKFNEDGRMQIIENKVFKQSSGYFPTKEHYKILKDIKTGREFIYIWNSTTKSSELEPLTPAVAERLQIDLSTIGNKEFLNELGKRLGVE